MWHLTISIITLNTIRQLKTNAAAVIPSAAPTILYYTIYHSINKAIIYLNLCMYCHILGTILNMSTIKDDKNKKPEGPLVITKQSPKKVKLGSPDFIFTTINHT